MKTKFIWITLSMAFICLLLSSCGPLIFKANFDSDTVGNDPNPNPPGAPSGDKIKGDCGITIVNSGILSSKAMRFYNESDCLIDAMWFESTTLSTSNQFLNYVFTGYPESTTHRTFNISFAGGHFRDAFTVKYQNGTMYLTDGNYTDHNIGTYTANQKQTFLVGINRATDKYALTISRSGTSNIQLSDRPVREANFWGQPAYILYLYYDTDDSSTSSNGYVIDAVSMNKEDED